MILPVMEKLIAKFSGDNGNAFFDPEPFAWTRMLEQQWTSIRAEAEALLENPERLPNAQDVLDLSYLTEADQWKLFLLYGFRHKVDDNCSRCPQTTRLLESVRGLETAVFSILAPGKHIAGHRGAYKGVLRYHLGLIVPRPHLCRIRVGNEIRRWEEGRSIIFDDTLTHEVWNESDEHRVVLLIDIERPLPFPLSVANRLVLRRISTMTSVRDSVERSRVRA
jgi:beta-hydroxylase